MIMIFTIIIIDNDNSNANTMSRWRGWLHALLPYLTWNLQRGSSQRRFFYYRWLFSIFLRIFVVFPDWFLEGITTLCCLFWPGDSSKWKLKLWVPCGEMTAGRTPTLLAQPSPTECGAQKGIVLSLFPAPGLAFGNIS